MKPKKSAQFVKPAQGNRYRMLALSVSRDCHIGLREALSLTLVEAYLAIGAEFDGG